MELRRKERLQPRNVDSRGWRRQEGLFSLVSVHAKAAAHVENYVSGGDGTRIWEKRQTTVCSDSPGHSLHLQLEPFRSFHTAP